MDAAAAVATTSAAVFEEESVEHATFDGCFINLLHYEYVYSPEYTRFFQLGNHIYNFL